MEPSYAVTASGRRSRVDPADIGGQQLVTHQGDLNPPSLALWHIALFLHPWDLVVDVGANHGEMLVGAPVPTGARVVAFEPNAALHPYLIRSLAEDGLTAEVPVTSLDELVGAAPCATCVKVDVGGSEPAVVAGAARLMDGTAPWALMLELHHLPATFVSGLAARRAVHLMDRRTNRLVRIPGGNPRLVDRMRNSSWLYGQDCLVLSQDLARSLPSPPTTDRASAVDAP